MRRRLLGAVKTPDGQVVMSACKSGPFASPYGPLWLVTARTVNNTNHTDTSYLHVERPPYYSDVNLVSWSNPAWTITYRQVWASDLLNDVVQGTIVDLGFFYTGSRYLPDYMANCG